MEFLTVSYSLLNRSSKQFEPQQETETFNEKEFSVVTDLHLEMWTSQSNSC